jgi:hypothetical protein
MSRMVIFEHAEMGDVVFGVDNQRLQGRSERVIESPGSRE